jgi:hypothetical protein
MPVLPVVSREPLDSRENVEVREAGKHVLDVGRKKKKRSVLSVTGTNVLEGRGETRRKGSLARQCPVGDVGEGEDDEEGSGTEVEEGFEWVEVVGDDRAVLRPVLVFSKTVRVRAEG